MTILSKLTSCNIVLKKLAVQHLFGFGVYGGLWLKTVVL